jgi:CheY-like chemotaxis protein
MSSESDKPDRVNPQTDSAFIEDALEGRDDIDLVFTDVQMPGTMDGIKLAHYVRDRWPPIQLIVVSGAAVLEESSLPTGSTFFSKPYHENAITDAIAVLLSAGSGRGQSPLVA